MTDLFIGARSGTTRNRAAVSRLGSRTLGDVVTRGDILGTGFDLGMTAEGSGADDIAAFRIAREQNRLDEIGSIQQSEAFITGEDFTRQGTPLSKEEFQDSEFNISGVEFQEGDTDVSLRIKAERARQDLKRQAILGSRDDFLSDVTLFSGALAGGIADPKNLSVGAATGLGVSGLVRGVAVGVTRGAEALTRTGRALTALKDTAQTGRVGRAVNRIPGKGRTVRTVAESGIATVPSIVTGLENTEFTGREYTADDAALDFAASLAFDVGLQFAGEGIRRLFQSTVPFEQRADVANVMHSQVRAAQAMQAQPMAELLAVENISEFSTVNANSADPTIRQMDDGTFEAFFEAERGVMADLGGKGDSIEAARSDLVNLYEDPVLAAERLGLTPETTSILRESAKVKRPVEDPNDLEGGRLRTFRATAEERGLPLKELDRRLEKREEVRRRKREAEAEQARNPDDPEVKKELLNARQAARRAERKVNDMMREDFAPILEQINGDPITRQKESRLLRQQAVEAYKQQKRQEFEKWIEEQTLDPSSPDARHLSIDREVRAFNPDDIREQASEAPGNGEDFGKNARESISAGRQQLDEMLESDLVDDRTKKEIRDEREEIENRKNDLSLMRQLIPCLEGPRNG